MSKINVFAIIGIMLSFATNAQTSTPLNLDFEHAQNGLPEGWQSFGNDNYKVYTDSIHSKSGRRSVVIEQSGEKAEFLALAINLRENYDGKNIRLSAFIKTENVSDGYAGLWMRIDPQVGFDNMHNRGVTGTTDWTHHEIELALNPEKTDKIVLGGLLVGKGKMWLDNLKVTVDGKDIESKNIKLFTKVLTPAQKDIEFDAGSNIVFPDLNNEKVANLELLGRVWGFLKYHHPAAAKGNVNWDYELFRVLPGYLDTQNKQQRDEILTNWIAKYGAVPPCRKCPKPSNDALIKPDLSWIDKSDISASLKSSLKEIHTNRHQGNKFYISLYDQIGNPHFTNENAYSAMPYPDAGFRLLSVYRYWNMIEYFFPNKHLTNKEWDQVLGEYIPKFIDAKSELEYELAALQIIGEINDSHANLWGGGNKIAELRGNNFAPFRAEFIEGRYVVTDYYNPEYSEVAKLKVGDIISHINGQPVEAIVDSLRINYPASNEASMLRDMAPNLMRSTKSSLSIGYISENQSQHHEVPLYDRGKVKLYYSYKIDNSQPSFKIMDGNIGYVSLANIQRNDISEIKKLFKNTNGIIIDIRNYPSAFVPFELGNFFMSESKPFVKFSMPNPDNPGEFTTRIGSEIPKSRNPYKGKLVVLVNEITQSQAEYTAMAFRAVNNSTIIGSTTAGADGNVSTIVLPGGLQTMISGIGVYYPDGTETQRVGIIPDVTVIRTIDGVKNGTDELLEKAVEIINL